MPYYNGDFISAIFHLYPFIMSVKMFDPTKYSRFPEHKIVNKHYEEDKYGSSCPLTVKELNILFELFPVIYSFEFKDKIVTSKLFEPDPEAQEIEKIKPESCHKKKIEILKN